MARIRSIKPEFWTSEQVMNLTASARLAFIGLWSFCDDGGNHPASAKTLKAEVFPSDDVASSQVQTLVDELLQQGLVVVYEAEGKQFWHVTGWHHQRIDKPTMKHPAFAIVSAPNQGEPVEPSTPARRELVEESTTTRLFLTPGVEGSGVERKGIEGIGKEPPIPPRGGRRAKFDPADEPAGFGAWWAVYERKDAKLDAIKAWRQLDPDDDLQVRIVTATKAWRWAEDRTKVPLPASWLRGRRWEDEGLRSGQTPNTQRGRFRLHGFDELDHKHAGVTSDGTPQD